MMLQKDLLRRTAVLLVFLVGAILTGCEQSPYSAVTGSVTYKGKPVQSGEVRLTPDTRAGNSGPAVVCLIKDGKYATPEGKGVVGGKYNLRIMGYGPAPKTNDPTASDVGASLFDALNQSAEFPKGEDYVHDIKIEE